jgi:hypothetical protein
MPKRLYKWDRIIVGLITNSDDRVPGILESFGITTGPSRAGVSYPCPAEAGTNSTPDIDFAVMSYDVGHEKPDQRIFKAAEKIAAELLPESTHVETIEKLYIGDDVNKDYDGARSAGWHSLLVHRHSDADFKSQRHRYRGDGSKECPNWEYEVEPGRWVEFIRDLGELAK